MKALLSLSLWVHFSFLLRVTYQSCLPGTTPWSLNLFPYKFLNHLRDGFLQLMAALSTGVSPPPQRKLQFQGCQVHCYLMDRFHVPPKSMNGNPVTFSSGHIEAAGLVVCLLRLPVDHPYLVHCVSGIKLHARLIGLILADPLLHFNWVTEETERVIWPWPVWLRG